jgi:cytochrome c-type biogenesis protein CcmE
MKGKLDTKFTITDFKNEVDVYYNGMAKFEFKEGETIVM